VSSFIYRHCVHSNDGHLYTTTVAVQTNSNVSVLLKRRVTLFKFISIFYKTCHHLLSAEHETQRIFRKKYTSRWKEKRQPIGHAIYSILQYYYSLPTQTTYGDTLSASVPFVVIISERRRHDIIISWQVLKEGEGENILHIVYITSHFFPSICAWEVILCATVLHTLYLCIMQLILFNMFWRLYYRY